MKIRRISALLFVFLLLIISSTCTQKINTSSTPTSVPQSPTVNELIYSTKYYPVYIVRSGDTYYITHDVIGAIKIPDDLSILGTGAIEQGAPPFSDKGYAAFAIKNIDESQAIAIELMAYYDNSWYYYFLRYNRVTGPVP